MASTTIYFGCLLLVLGLAAFAFTGFDHPTAMIPALFGIAFIGLGQLAKHERRRKHVMHAAVVVAAVGFGGSFGGLLKLPEYFAGTAARPGAVVAQSIMAVVTLVFLVLAIKSFVDARRGRGVMV